LKRAGLGWAVREPPNAEPPNHRAPHPNTLSGRATALQGTLTLGTGGAEASLASAVGCGFEKLHLREERGCGPHEDKLGDPGSLLYQKGLLAIVVDQGYHYLAAVARVDEAWCVDEGDAMPHRQPAAREHEPRVALGNGDRDSRPHHRPSTRRERHFFHRAQIIAGIPGMRPNGRLGAGYEAPKGYAQREILVHPQNGSTGRLQATGFRHQIGLCLA
jgi:hypothetical protein